MPADLLKQQYQLLKGSRHVLFTYCRTIPVNDLKQELKSFGHGSIHNLLCHIADVYIHWLQNTAQNKQFPYVDRRLIHSINDVELLYRQIDLYVDDFINAFADRINSELTLDLPGKEKRVMLSPLTLFTHVLTHEYHHKGQIASMGRQLGYIAPDTDMIRT